MKMQEVTAKKKIFWQNHIESWQKSGLSQRDYCRSKSLALSTFAYWRGKIGKTGGEQPKFYPLAVLPDFTAMHQETTSAMRLNLCEQRFQVEIPDNFSEQALKRLIFTLTQL
jgi:hypothetical protein